MESDHPETQVHTILGENCGQARVQELKGGQGAINGVNKPQVDIKLNGNGAVAGVLRGFDQFMNVVLVETVEETSAGEKNELGMLVIRGNSVILLLLS